MANVAVYNMEGKEVGSLELNDAIFGVEVNEHLVHMAVLQQLANNRQGTQKAKTRSEVSGGGRKPWRQKGTGHARQGSTRAPQWTHGGVVFAPVPRDYSFKLNKKEKRAALKSALTSRVNESKFVVVDELKLDEIKTKKFVEVMNNLKVEKALVVLNDNDVNVIKSASNLATIKTAQTNEINVYDILKYDTVVVTKDAVKTESMAAYDRIYNFSAGPSMLPLPALERASREMMNYGGSGMSVMEMSHRSKAFQKIFDDTQAKFRRLMNVPEGYKILFLQGGASSQFSMVPLNLIGKTGKADYAVTGNFANIAYKEATKYGDIHVAASSEDQDFTYIPTQDQLQLTPDASYFYYCANNTIYGTEWQYVPETGDVPLVCDMSSDILSRQVDVSKYGIIFAGAQKNMAPAGLTVAIVKEELAGHELPYTPLMMNYKTMIDKDSMYNTPPCWCIYMLGLVLDWLDEQGGIPGMEKIKHGKAQMLYDVIDSSKLFTAAAKPGSRSDMNVTFRTGSADLDAKFVAESIEAGFSNLKGHRKVGGMRASIYNAMPVEGVEKLCDFIKKFDKENT